MALRTYVTEAWEDIDDLQYPEVDGARESAECARLYVDDAWEDVWNGDGEFIVTTDRASTISGDTVTIAFSWSAQSGGSGNFHIYGDFKAGKEYTLEFLCTTGPNLPAAVTGSSSDSSDLTTVSLGSTKSLISGSKYAFSFKPDRDLKYITLTISTGGQYAGSSTTTFANLSINGNLCIFE